MSLARWFENGWLHRHETSAREITELVEVAGRALANARVEGLTPDAKIGLAYPAVLAMGSAAMAAAGYRVGRERQHERVIDSLAHTVGVGPAVIGRLHRFRRLRNEMTYERLGNVSLEDAEAFLALTEGVRSSALVWLEQRHPGLIS